jgi:flagellar basal-body rod protein FlgF
VLANNLANASTNGFRAEMAAFRAVPVRGDGASTRVYALESTIGYDDRRGPDQPTGRELDVAVQGNAWLSVQGSTAPRPTPAPVRSGQPTAPWSPPPACTVVGDGGPITLPPVQRRCIAEDGTVSATSRQRPASRPSAGSSW